MGKDSLKTVISSSLTQPRRALPSLQQHSKLYALKEHLLSSCVSFVPSSRVTSDCKIDLVHNRYTTNISCCYTSISQRPNSLYPFSFTLLGLWSSSCPLSVWVRGFISRSVPPATQYATQHSRTTSEMNDTCILINFMSKMRFMHACKYVHTYPTSTSTCQYMHKVCACVCVCVCVCMCVCVRVWVSLYEALLGIFNSNKVLQPHFCLTMADSIILGIWLFIRDTTCNVLLHAGQARRKQFKIARA